MNKYQYKKLNFSQILIGWYRVHGRHDLPWQKNATAYRVWISEVMLQQTQVSTVVPYFLRFIQRFPSIKSLATATENEVLELWSGLGYYSRARNLYRAAQQIYFQHHGRFPKNLEKICELPGIGRSTAGAIISLGLKQSAPILDGNVKRVLTRYFAVTEPIDTAQTISKLWEIARAHTPQTDCHSYNQAIMDLGATICTSRKPNCSRCPLSETCQAHNLGTTADFPVKRPKKSRPIKYTKMAIVLDKKFKVFLERRHSTGIWGGLWSFPEFDSEEDVNSWCSSHFHGTVHSNTIKWSPITHNFTHFQLIIDPVIIQLKRCSPIVIDSMNQFWYNLNDHFVGGLPKPVFQLVNRIRREFYGSND